MARQINEVRMVEPSLEFIAERLERLQTEFRAFRHLSSDVAQLRADVLRVQEDLSDLRQSHEMLRESHDTLREYTLELRKRIDAGFTANDGHFSAIQAQFDQMARQMATNLEIVLAEIRLEQP
jgi:predicted nuclease with TOPRIM domain